MIAASEKIYIILGLIIFSLFLLRSTPSASEKLPELLDYHEPPSSVSSAEIQTIIFYIRDVLIYKAVPDDIHVHPSFHYPVHLEIRYNGKSIISVWSSHHKDASGNIKSILQSVKDAQNLPKDFKPHNAVISLTLFYSPSLYDSSIPLNRFFHRGIDGIYASCQSNNKSVFIPNSHWLIKNRKQEKMIETTLKGIDCSIDDLGKNKAYLAKMKTWHWVQKGNEEPVLFLDRGDKNLFLKDITHQNLENFLIGTKKWIENNLKEDGQLEYKYWPSKDTHSVNNNLIRQWMTTHAIAELALYFNDDTLWEKWALNAQYNINKFYQKENDYGYFIYNDESKLGSSAVAAMALGSGKEHLKKINSGHKIYNELILGIRRLRQDDGSFRTWFLPPERNDNQAFYPGEALLALALGMKQSLINITPQSLKNIHDYYMEWWLQHDKELAFIPWHTQAYYHLYDRTRDEDYVQSIFTMNDHLVTCQLQNDSSQPDLVGQYYIPGCEKYGPPHASSTAVYTEGLAYAYDLARQKGDKVRMDRYRNAILLGLRSLLQLQVTETNSWYMGAPHRALGGIRTTVYNNEIRCDNVQHSIMAVLAVLHFLPQEIQE